MKTNKRLSFLSLLLAITLLLSCCTLSKTQNSLPQIGQETAGFVVKEIIPMEQVGGTGILYEHEKSGAHLLYVQNDDTNRSFSIAVKTPALDDKGIPHIFEHATLCGNDKYPDPNIFFPLVNQTYNTFINAMTYTTMTEYLGASLSEDQLFTIADFELSAVFHPLIYQDSRLKDREAWRYELQDKDSPITIAGTVYSEMRGNMNVPTLAYMSNTKTLYEGSTTAHVSGGLPDAIKTVTYDDLISFHNTYYVPSNTLVILYGKLDIERFLTAFDKDYFSQYDNTPVSVDKGLIAPKTSTNTKTWIAPASEGSETSDASEIYYLFALNDISPEDCVSIDILSSALNLDSSPLMKTMKEKLPKADLYSGVVYDASTPYFYFNTSGVDASDKDTFVSAIDEALDEIVTSGIDKDALDSVKSQHKLSLSLLSENTNLGITTSQSISLFWSNYGTLDYFPIEEKATENLTTTSATDLVKTYLVDNAHRAVSITVPEAGLVEKQAADLEQELADKKAKMSSEEIDAMVAKSKDFLAWSSKSADPAIVSQLDAVSASTLPEDLVTYAYTDKTQDNVRYLTSIVPVDNIAINSIMLDAETLPIDKLLDVETYLSFLGNLDTKEHTKEELANLTTRYFGGLFIPTLSASKGYNGKPDLYRISYQWMQLGEDVPAAFALAKEIIFDTDFSDLKTIKEELERQRTSFTNSIDSASLYIQLSRSRAMESTPSAFNEYLTNFQYNSYLSEVLKTIEEDPEQFLKRMDEAKTLVNNQYGAIIMTAGDKKSVAACKKAYPEILSGMSNTQREKVDYSSLKLPRRNEAIATNSTVNMNVIASDTTNYSGKDFVLTKLLEDLYLLPILRNQYGAYGAYCYIGNSDTSIYSYRDPNLENTFKVYAEAPEYLRSAEIDQATIDHYIIGTYSGSTRPLGKLTGTLQEMSGDLTGLTSDIMKQRMREMKATNIEDVRAFADTIQKLIDDGIYTTSGQASKIKGSTRFDVLIHADGTEEALK